MISKTAYACTRTRAHVHSHAHAHTAARAPPPAHHHEPFLLPPSRKDVVYGAVCNDGSALKYSVDAPAWQRDRGYEERKVGQALARPIPPSGPLEHTLQHNPIPTGVSR